MIILLKKRAQTHCHVCGVELEQFTQRSFRWDNPAARYDGELIDGRRVVRTCPNWDKKFNQDSNGHYRRVWQMLESGDFEADPPPKLLCMSWSG